VPVAVAVAVAPGVGRTREEVTRENERFFSFFTKEKRKLSIYLLAWI
jgi:hypothetical protein